VATNPFDITERFLREVLPGTPLPEDLYEYFRGFSERLQAARKLPIKRFDRVAIQVIGLRSSRGKRIPLREETFGFIGGRSTVLSGFVFLELLRGKTLNKSYEWVAAQLGVSTTSIKRAWAKRDWRIIQDIYARSAGELTAIEGTTADKRARWNAAHLRIVITAALAAATGIPLSAAIDAFESAYRSAVVGSSEWNECLVEQERCAAAFGVTETLGTIEAVAQELITRNRQRF
jgi:hypothetical protein